MPAYNQKPKSIGSAYVNVKKGSDETVVQEVADAVAFLKEKGAFLKLSIRAASGEYVSLTGFFNDYKKPGSKDADIILRASQVATRTNAPQTQAPVSTGFKPRTAPKSVTTPRKAAPVAAPVPTPVQETTDQFDGEGVPF